MAEDPTTTKKGQTRGEKLIALNFSTSIAGRVVVIREKQYVNVELYYPKNLQDAPPGIIVSFTASSFKTEDQLKAWAFNVAHAFRDRLQDVLFAEMAPLLFEQVHYELQRLGQPANLSYAFEVATNIRKKTARERLGMKRVGRGAKWRDRELEAEIKRAFAELKPRERNYEGVANKLRQWHGDRAPESGGALRQQVIRLGLDWKALKQGAAFRRREASISYETKT